MGIETGIWALIYGAMYSIFSGVSVQVAWWTATILTQVLIYGSLMAASYAANSLLAGKSDRQSSMLQNGHLVNAQSQTEPIKIIYGKIRVGCNRVFIHAGGARNKYLNIAAVLGEGPIEGIFQDSDGDILYLDERRKSFYEAYKGKDLFDYAFYKGTWDQGIDSILSDATNGNPNWADRMRWAAYCVMRLKFNASAWAQLPDATFVILGRKLFDPRTGMVSYYQTTRIKTQANAGDVNIDVDDTTGMVADRVIKIMMDNGVIHASTIHAVVDGDTVTIHNAIPTSRSCPVDYQVEFDGPMNIGQNCALVWYDHMIHRRYSMGVPRSLIDTDSVIAAANTCDANGWQFNGSIMDRKPFIDNLIDIENSFRAGHIWSLGKYYLKILGYDTPVVTLTESEIGANPDKFRFSEGGIPEIPDRLTVFFCDPLDNYIAKPLPLMIPGIVSSDRIEDNPQEMALIGITNYQMAFDIGAYHLKRMRASKIFTIPCHPRTVLLDPIDMVQITHSFPGWSNQILRIKNMGLPQQGLIPITFMEESADIYTGSGVTVASHSAYQSTLPNPDQTLEDPTNVAAATGADEETQNKVDAYIEFSCDNLGPGFDYEWQWRESGDSKWDKKVVKDPNGEIPAPAFTGTGTLLMATDGEFTGVGTLSYRVQIDGTGSPNTFKWSDTGGSVWNATGVAITTAKQDLNNGVKLQFKTTTEGVAADRWNFTCVFDPVVKFRAGKQKCGVVFFYRVRSNAIKQISDWAYGPTTITAWAPGLPTMSGYSPIVTPIKQGKQLKVDWASWSGFGAANVKDYEVYCSTEATCTIAEANLVRKGIKSSNYTIVGLSRSVTYDVRVRPMGFSGAGVESS